MKLMLRDYFVGCERVILHQIEKEKKTLSLTQTRVCECDAYDFVKNFQPSNQLTHSKTNEKETQTHNTFRRICTYFHSFRCVHKSLCVDYKRFHQRRYENHSLMCSQHSCTFITVSNTLVCMRCNHGF